MHNDSTPLVIAHRGASGYRPEHTVAAIELGFALGADAVEPDVVLSRDGVPVVRHENEISGTTDVAKRPEFAHLRTTKIVDGAEMTGWFTEDFTWAELQTLRCRERLPKLRPHSTAWDGRYPILRLADVFGLVDAACARFGRQLTTVVELKHADYYLRQGWDLAAVLAAECELEGWQEKGDALVVESFELGVLQRVRASGLPCEQVFLVESFGAPAEELQAACAAGSLDSVQLGQVMAAYLGVPGAVSPSAEVTAAVFAQAEAAGVRSYEWYRSAAGLAFLAGEVDGISVPKRELLELDAATSVPGDFAKRAAQAGLYTYTWTLRPENHFLLPQAKRGDSSSSWGAWQQEYAAILASGVQGIFVDQPDLGRLAVTDFLAAAR